MPSFYTGHPFESRLFSDEPDGAPLCEGPLYFHQQAVEPPAGGHTQRTPYRP
jgi:hypothetical protein